MPAIFFKSNCSVESHNSFLQMNNFLSYYNYSEIKKKIINEEGNKLCFFVDNIELSCTQCEWKEAPQTGVLKNG